MLCTVSATYTTPAPKQTVWLLPMWKSPAKAPTPYPLTLPVFRAAMQTVWHSPHWLSATVSFYPGYTVNITEVLVNGEPYTLTAKPYTTSDDARCTRVNLYNEWVTQVPGDARTPDGDTTGISPVIVDNADLTHMETLSITFEYAPGK